MWDRDARHPEGGRGGRQLTFGQSALGGGRGVQLRRVALGDAQQGPHQLGELPCAQAPPALGVEDLEERED